MKRFILLSALMSLSFLTQAVEIGKVPALENLQGPQPAVAQPQPPPQTTVHATTHMSRTDTTITNTHIYSICACTCKTNILLCCLANHGALTALKILKPKP
jgi:hypothetical protein